MRLRNYLYILIGLILLTACFNTKPEHKSRSLTLTKEINKYGITNTSELTLKNVASLKPNEAQDILVLKVKLDPEGIDPQVWTFLQKLAELAGKECRYCRQIVKDKSVHEKMCDSNPINKVKRKRLAEAGKKRKEEEERLKKGQEKFLKKCPTKEEIIKINLNLEHRFSEHKRNFNVEGIEYILPNHIYSRFNVIFGKYKKDKDKAYKDVVIKEYSYERVVKHFNAQELNLAPKIIGIYKDKNDKIFVFMEKLPLIDCDTFNLQKTDSKNIILDLFKKLKILNSKVGKHSIEPLNLVSSLDNNKDIKFIGFESLKKYTQFYRKNLDNPTSLARTILELRFKNIFKKSPKILKFLDYKSNLHQFCETNILNAKRQYMTRVKMLDISDIYKKLLNERITKISYFKHFTSATNSVNKLFQWQLKVKKEYWEDLLLEKIKDSYEKYLLSPDNDYNKKNYSEFINSWIQKVKDFQKNRDDFWTSGIEETLIKFCDYTPNNFDKALFKIASGYTSKTENIIEKSEQAIKLIEESF